MRGFSEFFRAKHVDKRFTLTELVESLSDVFSVIISLSLSLCPSQVNIQAQITLNTRLEYMTGISEKRQNGANMYDQSESQYYLSDEYQGL